MNFLFKLFSEKNEVSCMRVMSMLSLLVGSAVAFYSQYKNCDLGAATPVISIFVGAAFGGKVWQKYAENKDAS